MIYRWPLMVIILVVANGGQSWAVETTTPSVDRPFSWQDGITLSIAVLGAGLGLLNFVVGIWREGQKRKADGAYLAMRLAVLLEAYAVACTDLMSRNEIARNEAGNQLPDWVPILPIFPEYPNDDSGWKAIKSITASYCFDLRNMISSSQSQIYHQAEHDPLGVGRHVHWEACQRGLDAWKLAYILRSEHKLRRYKPAFRYDRYLMREYANIVREDLENDGAGKLKILVSKLRMRWRPFGG